MFRKRILSWLVGTMGLLIALWFGILLHVAMKVRLSYLRLPAALKVSNESSLTHAALSVAAYREKHGAYPAGLEEALNEVCYKKGQTCFVVMDEKYEWRNASKTRHMLGLFGPLELPDTRPLCDDSSRQGIAFLYSRPSEEAQGPAEDAIVLADPCPTDGRRSVVPLESLRQAIGFRCLGPLLEVPEQEFQRRWQSQLVQ